MRNALIVALLFVIPCLPSPASAQESAKVTLSIDAPVTPDAPIQAGGEHHTTTMRANAEVGHPIIERLVPQNMVELTWRHCQSFEKKKGFWLHRHTVIDAEACAADPSTIFAHNLDHNLRTNAGGDWQASVMSNTAAPPATANYIALSNDATAPSTSDTTLASEIATNGLSRAQGVYAHTNGTASYTVQKVFSATGTQASQKAGLFNASSSGTMVFENTYTQVTVNNGDTLTVTWTINY